MAIVTIVVKDVEKIGDVDVEATFNPPLSPLQREELLKGNNDAITQAQYVALSVTTALAEVLNADVTAEYGDK